MEGMEGLIIVMYSGKNEEYSTELFSNPGSEYRSAPFWAWNCKLDKDLMEEQIKIFRQMGFGGFHCHVRTGMASPYLTDEFMDFIRFAQITGEREGLLTYLYDEDRWPSGTVGGKITRENPEYRLQYLVFTTEKMQKGRDKAGGVIGTVFFRQKDEGLLAAAFDVELDETGCLKKYTLWHEGDGVSGTLWYMYQMEGDLSEWFNHGTYLDTMNKRAVREFISLTHERYKGVFGKEFGHNMKTIFTDEPQVLNKVTLGFAEETKDCWLPWTGDFAETFYENTGMDIISSLPELVWELPDQKVSRLRYAYHDHVAERFVSAYVDTIGAWCSQNGIGLTGHMLKEPTLQSQTESMGDVMRGYRSMQLPGIDMLHNLHEYNTAKQCQSMVRQLGCEGMMCEIYGVTGWDFDFRGFKLQGDWLAALGVTFRVPHLTWMSMEGEAKRDYPPGIGQQSPWYSKFNLIEDYFARLNTVLTRGKGKVDVAVIHPIESYWLHWGPSSQTQDVRDRMEKHFSELTEMLLFGLVDFDFISESCLPDLYSPCESALKIGEMEYRTVIVPDCETLRKTTVAALHRFQNAGGRLLFLSGCPGLVDAVESDEVQAIYKKAEKASFDKASVLDALKQERFLDIQNERGVRTDFLIYQLREDKDVKWLFIAAGKDPASRDVDAHERLTITLDGYYKIRVFHPQRGTITAWPAPGYENGKTILRQEWHMHDSLLLELSRGQEERACEVCGPEKEVIIKHRFQRVPITLSEPNALLLDYAEYAMNEEPYNPAEEVLRIDNICRKKLGIPLRKKNVCQPYMMEKLPAAQKVRLRFEINSKISLDDIKLAIESPELFEIIWNHQRVPAEPDGYYVDHGIKTIPLPGLKAGTNILEIVEPMAEWTNMEWCYLLGDFGVHVEGILKTVVAPVRELAFCNYAEQGLPFYTGNLTWHTEIGVAGDERVSVRIPAYRGALVSVFLDGEAVGDVVYSPYELKLPHMPPGTHQVDFMLYGNRENGFAQLHHDKTVPYKKAPDSWRSEGDLWVDGYQLVPMGILKSPEFIFEKTKNI